ncbi:GDYXXLXY domain-containing protein [Ahrensia sp. 13_GOM-1096m]|uniref:GDYXXLXY domain-containing protein n=1 Tax=Ahrensia sp. 13_GOM-1096m TaxID=1380380 RepID=UPI000686D466|nr:GDYXXLXY domain-containing protein [Ahrensia sp. 13_GOM-1096m]
MNTNSKKPFHLAGALITIALMWASVLWMIESRASILRGGQEIVLKTEPIDPRDFLRGRYVRLNFDISRVLVENFEDMFAGQRSEVLIGTPVYVILKKNAAGRDEYVSLQLQKPESGRFIKGKIRSVGLRNDGNEEGYLSLEYGIERFYASETVAPDLEKRMRDGEVTDIIVAVSADGIPQIKALRQGNHNFLTEVFY